LFYLVEGEKMGKVIFYTMLILLALTVICFVSDYHTFAYIIGSIFGSVALGAGYVYSSKDDKLSTNYLNTNDLKKHK
jgi:hypothetical protein